MSVLCAAASLLIAGHAARAQTVDDRTPAAELAPTDDTRPNEMITDRFARQGLEQGTHIGNLLVSPTVHGGFGYDDNIFGEKKSERIGDTYADYGAGVGAQYNYDTLNVGLTGNIDDRRYLSQTAEDYWTAGARVNVIDQLSHRFGLIGTGGIAHDIIPRGSPLDTNGLTPESYDLYDIEPGIQIGDPQTNYATVQFGYNQSRYAPVPTATSIISGRDRDRRELFGDVRFNHHFFDRQLAYLEIRPDGRNYAIDPDPAGFRRNNSGIRVDAGMSFDINALFLVNVMAGYQHRQYADPRYGTIGEPDVTLDVLWTPSKLTTVDFKFVHEYFEEVYEDGIISTPGYRHNQETIQVDHEFRRNLIGSVGLVYDAEAFVRATRSYAIFSPTASVQYLFNNGLSLKFDYNYTYQSENTPNQYYYRNVFMLNLIKRF